MEPKIIFLTNIALTSVLADLSTKSHTTVPSFLKPAPLLRSVIREVEDFPGLAGFCAGFEGGNWRSDQLAEHLVEWLPEFALNEHEYSAVGGSSARRALRQAAETIYTSMKYEKRGEVGEILLHAIIRQEYGSEPLVSKIFFKDSPNDTVKGFDAVHIVETSEELQLWLGEVKLYTSIASAIRDVIAELKVHTQVPYLRTEFAAICRKIDSGHKHARVLKALLDPNSSMDEIFGRICIPVLLIYDSPVVAAYSKTTPDYEKELILEFNAHFEKFTASGLPSVDIILMLLPMNNKKALLARFDAKLKGLLA